MSTLPWTARRQRSWLGWLWICCQLRRDPAIGQREAISSAIAAANTAVGVVTDAATDEEVTAAETAIAAAKKAIADAANVPAEEAAANSGTVSVLETALANAKTSRTTAMDKTGQGRR